MRSLRRPMFRYGGDVKAKGVMHGMKNMQDGGPATMADATGLANGGMPNMRGRVTGPGGYAGIPGKVPGMLPINETPRTRLNIGVPDQPATKVKNFYNKGLEKAGKVKSFFKSPSFSERGIKTIAQRKIPQYAKGIARSIGSLAGGLGSKFPLATTLLARNPYLYAYKASEVTPVDKKYNISRYRDNLFAPLQTGDTSRDIMQKKALRNAEQAANPNNFYRYDSGKYGPRKDHPNYDPKKIRYNPFSKDTGAADTEIPRDADGNIIRYNDAESMFGFKKLKATPGYSKEDRKIKKDTTIIPEVKGTQEERDAYSKKYKADQDDAKLKNIYRLLGVDRAQRGAASKALADMSRYIDEGGKDTISKKNIASTLTKGILAFDKRLDKADQLKEAAGLMIAKGEIEKDIYGSKPGTQLKAAQDYQSQFGGSIKDAYKALDIGGKDMARQISDSLMKGGRKSTDLVEAAYQAEGNPPAILTVKSKEFDKWEDDNDGKNELDYVETITDRKPGAYVVGTRVVIVDKDLKPSFYY